MDELTHTMSRIKKGRRLKRMPLWKKGRHQPARVEQIGELTRKQKGVAGEAECSVEAKGQEGFNGLSLV